MSRQFILGLAILISSISMAHADDYYSGSGKGWWWYDRDKPAAEQPDTEQKNKIKPTPEPKEHPLANEKFGRDASLYNYSYDDVWGMHPDDFYELQESIKKRAVQNPSEANVKEYYEAQEIARKKALAFTNSSMYVWQKYPELSTAKDYPTATPGHLANVGNSINEKIETLKSNKDSFALIYFKKPNCSFCTEQSKILEWFKSQTGWTIKPVDIAMNPGAAAKFGIDIVPSLILIQKGNQDFFPVSAGVIAANEIEEKTFRAVRMLKGTTNQEDFSLYEHQRGGGYDVNKKPKNWGNLR